MKWLMISAFAVVALIAAAASVPQPHSPSAAPAAVLMSLQEPNTKADINKLPIEDFEDMSLVFSTAPKR